MENLITHMEFDFFNGLIIQKCDRDLYYSLTSEMQQVVLNMMQLPIRTQFSFDNEIVEQIIDKFSSWV